MEARDKPTPNPSYGFMLSENLSAAEIAERRAEYELEERLEELEADVIEAALEYRQNAMPANPEADAPLKATLWKAVDALLRERNQHQDQG